MRVSVILDEANKIRDTANTLARLKLIQNALSPIAKNVRLILAGTGYDTAVSFVDSKTDVFKYNTKPWGQEQLMGILEKNRNKYYITEEKYPKIKMALNKNPALLKIATNTELQSVFFEDKYFIEGESVPVKVR